MNYKLNASKNNKPKNLEILNWLEKNGWVIDQWGHAKKTFESGRTYRYKFQSTTIRKEVKVIHEASLYSPESVSWVRLKTLSYKDIVLK